MAITNLGFEGIENSAKEITGQIVDSVNESEVVEGFAKGIVNALPDNILNKLSIFLDIGKIFLIILIAYLVFILIKQFWKFKDSYRLGIIAKNSEEIVKKLGTIREQNDEMISKFEKKNKDKK